MERSCVGGTGTALRSTGVRQPGEVNDTVPCCLRKVPNAPVGLPVPLFGRARTSWGPLLSSGLGVVNCNVPDGVKIAMAGT